MNKRMGLLLDVGKTIFGTALFGLGFSLFLAPNHMNAGGLSGLAMIIVELLDFGSVGTLTALFNLPLFALAGLRIGKKFFWGSLLGMALLSISIDLCALIPAPETERLVGALYGGVLCGAGGGFVFASGFSTGGSDIIVRLMKKQWPHVSLGIFTMLFDLTVAVLTAIVYKDIGQALYCGIAVVITGWVVDMVIYRFDYSKVALIISDRYESITQRIGDELSRGATLLHGEGSYSHQSKEVILTAVKKQQIADLKQLVVEEDPDAFIIVQEAHQVLGDGFASYTKDSL